MLSDGGGRVCRDRRHARCRIDAGRTSSRASGRSHSMDAPTRRLAQYHGTLNPTRPCQSWHCDGNVGRSAWYVRSHASREAIAMIAPESALRRRGCELLRQDCCTRCLVDAAAPLVHIFINVPLTLTLPFALHHLLQPVRAPSARLRPWQETAATSSSSISQQGTHHWADVPVSLDHSRQVH